MLRSLFGLSPSQHKITAAVERIWMNCTVQMYTHNLSHLVYISKWIFLIQFSCFLCKQTARGAHAVCPAVLHNGQGRCCYNSGPVQCWHSSNWMEYLRDSSHSTAVKLISDRSGVSEFLCLVNKRVGLIINKEQVARRVFVSLSVLWSWKECVLRGPCYWSVCELISVWINYLKT